MSAKLSVPVIPDALSGTALDPRRLVLTPLLVRILALVAVMLLAHLP
jgi:hypothetical protein